VCFVCHWPSQCLIGGLTSKSPCRATNVPFGTTTPLRCVMFCRGADGRNDHSPAWGRNQKGDDRGLLGWARIEAIRIRAISEIRGSSRGEKLPAITDGPRLWPTISKKIFFA